jgi:hypothetical protein
VGDHPLSDEPPDRAYAVAISYACESREYVGAVAEELKKGLGERKVFFDRHYEPTLGCPGLDTNLSKIYPQAGLIAIFFSSGYGTMSWTELEWKMACEVEERQPEKIMYLCLDGSRHPLLPPIAGYVNCAGHSPQEIAGLIMRKLDSLA